jgi:hypothetical protein
MQNSFPMIDWHIKHLEKVILKFVTGLAENATSWEKRNNKRYGRIGIVCRQIDYDIKHGATNDQVVSLLKKIRNDSSFSDLRDKNGSLERLGELEKNYQQQPVERKGWWY